MSSMVSTSDERGNHWLVFLGRDAKCRGGVTWLVSLIGTGNDRGESNEGADSLLSTVSTMSCPRYEPKRNPPKGGEHPRRVFEDQRTRADDY